jgi:hypothetical protein
MASAGFNGGRLAICPACGYPKLGAGLCAACIQTPAATPVEPKLDATAGFSRFNPAA